MAIAGVRRPGWLSFYDPDKVHAYHQRGAPFDRNHLLSRHLPCAPQAGVPAVFVSQLLFSIDTFSCLIEKQCTVRARDMRSFGSRGSSMKGRCRLIGVLFLRTVERGTDLQRMSPGLQRRHAF
jgi:hypothetical protein